MNIATPESKEARDYYEAWKKKNFGKSERGGNRDEYDVVKEVRDRYVEMRNARENSCYLMDGGSWSDKWDRDDKIALLWASYGAFANGESNVKSPMACGRINAFVNQYKKLSFSYQAFPNNDDDVAAAKIASKVLDNVEKLSSSKAQRSLAAEESAKYGDGFYRETYLVEKKKNRFAKTKGFTPEEEEKIKEGEVLFGEEEERVVFDAPVSIYVPIRELYWDPSARFTHGPAYAARDVIWRRIMPLKAAKKLLESMPNTKNIDKIKATSTYAKDPQYVGFFEAPSDTTGGDYVEWLEYENTDEDQYRIIVNDICVLDTPLPWNHKQITYFKFSYKITPGQFYSRGLCDELSNIQGAEEVIANMATDYVFTSYRNKWFVASSIAEEVDEDAMSNQNQMIIIDDNGGASDIRTKVQQVVNSPIGFDLFRLFDIYERQATIASGMDPAQLSLMPQGKTATATLQNKEQLESTIGGVIENFVTGALNFSGKQRWELIQQHWKLPRIKDIVGDNKKKVKGRTIRLAGMEIKINEDKGLQFKDSDKEYSFFDVSDYLDTKEELEISIAPDSIEIESKGLRQQKAQQLLQQLMPFMVDPNNLEMMAQHQFPYINGPKLMQRTLENLNESLDLLITPEENEEGDRKRAEDNIMKIVNGGFVAGVPGSSVAYRKFVATFLFSIQAKRSELEQQIEEDMQDQMENMQPTFNPMTGQPVSIEPQPDIKVVKELEKIEDVIGRLGKHLNESNMPSGLIEEGALEAVQSQQPMAQQQPMQMPDPNAMGGMDPSMMGGMGMDPNAMTPQIMGGMSPGQPMM